METGTFRARCTWLDLWTGKSGVYTEEPSAHGSIWMDQDTPPQISSFQWDAGNYSCDCARGQFFVGEENVPCNGIPRFVITRLEALTEDGDVVKVWDDYEPMPKP